LEEIISIDTGVYFITFEIKSLGPISLTNKIFRHQYFSGSKIKNTRTLIDIDFSADDIIVPRQQKRKLPIQLPNFEAQEVSSYSVETTVAEKLDMILFLMDFLLG
jgi:hypothetical protein